MAGTPVNTAQEGERELNFWESLYLPEIFKGLGYSFNKFANEPEYTQQYPEEQWYPPDGYRGRPVLVEEEGSPRCVSCNLCAKACPPMAISMQSQEIDDPADPKEREPQWFEINMLRCIYCGYCEEVCPEEAIVMSKEYDLTFQSRDEAVFGIERLLQPAEQLIDRLNYLKSYRDPQFGEQWEFQKDNNLHSLKDRHFLQWLKEEGMDELETTHTREEAATPSDDMDWGSKREGPPESSYDSPGPGASEAP
ncbi:MAG: NADH-quinone oxidoreductase subunit I [Bacteroidetes bacterium QS_8_64_10]|jgi:NADH-quinone oxidoreductase subunit I|nr:MAG: NADH-quinone oxidoreductase subunit I [Bacteroidetes bacterium QS_8_64_10]